MWDERLLLQIKRHHHQQEFTFSITRGSFFGLKLWQEASIQTTAEPTSIPDALHVPSICPCSFVYNYEGLPASVHKFLCSCLYVYLCVK